MQSTQLTGNQVKALRERVVPMADYLGRLKRRLAKQAFSPDDPLTAKVADALAAVTALANELASLDIDFDVGQSTPSRAEAEGRAAVSGSCSIGGAGNACKSLRQRANKTQAIQGPLMMALG